MNNAESTMTVSRSASPASVSRVKKPSMNAATTKMGVVLTNIFTPLLADCLNDSMRE